VGSRTNHVPFESTMLKSNLGASHLLRRIPSNAPIAPWTCTRVHPCEVLCVFESTPSFPPSQTQQRGKSGLAARIRVRVTSSSPGKVAGGGSAYRRLSGPGKWVYNHTAASLSPTTPCGNQQKDAVSVLSCQSSIQRPGRPRDIVLEPRPKRREAHIESGKIASKQ